MFGEVLIMGHNLWHNDPKARDHRTPISTTACVHKWSTKVDEQSEHRSAKQSNLTAGVHTADNSLPNTFSMPWTIKVGPHDPIRGFLILDVFWYR